MSGHSICFRTSITLLHVPSFSSSAGDKDNEELRDSVTCSSCRAGQYYWLQPGRPVIRTLINGSTVCVRVCVCVCVFVCVCVWEFNSLKEVPISQQWQMEPYNKHLSSHLPLLTKWEIWSSRCSWPIESVRSWIYYRGERATCVWTQEFITF